MERVCSGKIFTLSHGGQQMFWLRITREESPLFSKFVLITT